LVNRGGRIVWNPIILTGEKQKYPPLIEYARKPPCHAGNRYSRSLGKNGKILG
jgi:hypothetical protein